MRCLRMSSFHQFQRSIFDVCFRRPDLKTFNHDMLWAPTSDPKHCVKHKKKIKMQSVLQVLPNQCGNILHVFYKWWSSTHPGLWTTESFEDAPRIQSWNLIIRSLVNNESIYLWNQILQHSQSSVDPVPTSLILVDGMKFSVSTYL